MKIENESNYIKAKIEADRVDEQIINVLKNGSSFLVEAGAGSGKTYSLNRVIDWIQNNQSEEFIKNKKRVACITYTNVAVEVIVDRIGTKSFIEPSTIHSFAWNTIKQFQGKLLSIIEHDDTFQVDATDFSKPEKVEYDLGKRYIKKNVFYLNHNDVIKLFVEMLNNTKFRNILAQRFPIILIDEYQDSNRDVIGQFIRYFIANNTGPQFGFFGDGWQTIYGSLNACGQINNPNLIVIKKGSNFRSEKDIVSFLNKIRPELPQIPSSEKKGKVVVVTCDDYTGIRRSDKNFKGDLPIEELRVRLTRIEDYIKSSYKEESLKVLMITHKLLASQQGYKDLLELVGDGLKDKQDIFIVFFMKTIEPIYQALTNSNMELLFSTLGIKRYPITKKSEKKAWTELKDMLGAAMQKKAIDVLQVAVESGLIPIPPDVSSYYRFYSEAPDLRYYDTTVKQFLNLEYQQFHAAIDFLDPTSNYSTEHGVKGEEYDNVVFVIGGGWNQYQFDKYIPLIGKEDSIPLGKEDAFIRNRNLFYVCCSRAKKRLIIFVSLKLEGEFRDYLESVLGKENIIPFNQFI